MNELPLPTSTLLPVELKLATWLDLEGGQNRKTPESSPLWAPD